MHFLVVVALTILAVLLNSSRVTLAQSQDDVIRVNTELVLVDAQFLEKKSGRIIGALGRNDFEFDEDGVKQEITFFSQDKERGLLPLGEAQETIVINRMPNFTVSAHDSLRFYGSQNSL